MSEIIAADVRYIVSESGDISGNTLIDNAEGVLLTQGLAERYKNSMDMNIPGGEQINLLVEKLFSSERGTVFLYSSALNPKRTPIKGSKKILYATLNYTSMERELLEALDEAFTGIFGPRGIEFLKSDEYSLLL